MFQDDPDRTTDTPGKAVRVLVKVVPGSRKSEIAGRYGDRLKVKVAAPPEDGRANAAVCELLASDLGLPARSVSVISGHASPQKTIRMTGLDAAELKRRVAGRWG